MVDATWSKPNPLTSATIDYLLACALTEAHSQAVITYIYVYSCHVRTLRGPGLIY